MKKRLMALLLLTGLLSAALTGCGGGSTEQASEDGQTADGSTEARAQANEIVVGIAQDLDESLDPHLAVAAGTKEEPRLLAHATDRMAAGPARIRLGHIHMSLLNLRTVHFTTTIQR